MKNLISVFLILVLAVSDLSAALSPALLAAAHRRNSGAVTFTDDFTRANENPLSKSGAWSNGISTWTALQLDTNKVRGTTGSTNASRVLTPTFPSNQRATISYIDVNVAALVRMDASLNGYFLLIQSSTNLQLLRLDAGAGTQLGANITISALTTGDLVGLDANGSTLTVYVNGVSQGTRTDATYSTGQPGLYCLSTGNNVGPFAAQ